METGAGLDLRIVDVGVLKMAAAPKASTIGQLRKSGYQVLPIREELRNNLIAKIRAEEILFPSIIGFEETVIPQLENAILAGQDIILLGERGQAKSRLIRVLVGLLDEYIPIVAQCEINDNPYSPVCRACRDRAEVDGDKLRVDWLPRDARYGEKLATPDISVADLIGEIDPIKVAEGRYLSDETTIHYGLIPRTNRGIFCINELPDLAERIQVSLFNLMAKHGGLGVIRVTGSGKEKTIHLRHDLQISGSKFYAATIRALLQGSDAKFKIEASQNAITVKLSGAKKGKGI